MKNLSSHCLQKCCSYNLLSSGLGVLSNSLARLTYSQGRPLESTLNSRPACGNSVGLCSDVKLVSRHSLWGGVPTVSNPHFAGLGGDSNARISCSISIVSRASEASADEPEGRRCGFAGPNVVTTWSVRWFNSSFGFVLF